MVIVSAALAQNTEPGGRNMDDLRYLQALYDAGWQGDFDVLAAQAFGLFTGPTDHRVSADRTNFGRMLLARDIMVKNGDAAKPVWITEMGWTSPPEDYPSTFGRVSEERRAEYTVRAYERIQSEWPWIGPAFLWFLRRPDDLWERAPEGYGFFRILGPDWSETPTYQALWDAANAPPVLRRGRHGLVAPGIYFSGPWLDEVDEDGRHVKLGSADAELQLSFQGTGFDVHLAAPVEGEDPPGLFMVVDGDSRTLSPAPDENGQWLLGAHGLTNDEHLAILRVEEGAPRIVEVDVTAPDSALPVDFPIWLAACGLLLVVGGAVLYGLWRWRWRRNELPPVSAPAAATDAVPAHAAEAPPAAESAAPTDADEATPAPEPAAAGDRDEAPSA